MQMRDFYSGFGVRSSILPQSLTAGANGAAVDLANVKAVCLHVAVGALVGAVIGVKLQESADGVTWADVPAALVQSDAPAALAANFAYRVGYLGGKRYVRPVIVWTSGTSAVVAAVAVVEPLVRPVP